MRVFLDANVLFSAASPGSVTDILVNQLQAVATPVTSDLAIEEARRNLRRKRSTWLPHFESSLDRLEHVQTVTFPLSVNLAKKDQPLLCSAIHASCDYFATGDARDFGHLYNLTIDATQVITMERLAELVAAAQATGPR